jgi:hypothetical protein
MKLAKQFLDYMVTQEEAVLTVCTSNMVLAIHIIAFYLLEPKVCSHAGIHMFMTGKERIPQNNGADSSGNIIHS